MKYFIFLFIAYLNTIFAIAQVELSRTNFDLGEITLLNADIVDFDIKNITANDTYILRIDADQEVGIQYTSKTIKSGSTESIRIKLNPKKKGKITRKVNLFLSSKDEPIVITISGSVKAIPKNNRQACPQFGSSLKPPTGKMQAVAKIKNFDLALYDENSDDQLTSIQRLPANESNEVEPSIRLTTTPLSIPTRKKQVTRTKKTPVERRNSPSIGQILFGKQTASDSSLLEKPEEEHLAVIRLTDTDSSKTVEVDTTTISEEVDLATETPTEVDLENIELNLLDNSFKPNNIVFLIDASNSMKEENRMDILKRAMIELLEPLREIDFLTIVTYSGEAKIILPPTSGKDKDEIELQINNLIADGSTNAVKGIKKAIQTGQSSFIDEGNNQIILATDGAFDIGSKNVILRQKIKKTADDGLTITVLGIKNENWTNKSLKEIVELGKGDLIRIRNERDASKVLKEVKRKAKKTNQ